MEYYWRVSTLEMANEVVLELKYRDIYARVDLDALGQYCVVTDEIGNMFLEQSVQYAF